MIAKEKTIPVKTQAGVCVVKQLTDGTRYCATHSYQLEEMAVPELPPFGEQSPIIDRNWRCPKGGVVVIP